MRMDWTSFEAFFLHCELKIYDPQITTYDQRFLLLFTISRLACNLKRDEKKSKI